MLNDVGALVAEFGQRDLETCQVVANAARAVIARLEGADLTKLARHNPGLRGYDWRGYIDASQFRVMSLVKMLRDRDCRRGRLLDQGSYFGNFSLALKELGYDVVASDYYREANGALDRWRELLLENGVTVTDSGSTGDSLPFEDQSFDIVISMGVIEHIPSSPRKHLLELARCLKMGSLLVVETPNQAYQYKRDLLAQGKSIMASIETQFETEYPFSGHYREFVADEVEWMLTRVGMASIYTRFMDYSYRSLSSLDKLTLEQVAFRKSDPSRQELILSSGLKERRVTQ